MLRLLSLRKTLFFKRNNIVSIKPVLFDRKENCALYKNPSMNYAICYPSLNTDLEKVYEGPLSSQIETLKVFSLSFGLTGLILHPLIITQASSISSTYSIAACSMAVVTFLTPVLMHLVTRRYVTEIVFDPTSGTYKATTIDFCLAKKQLHFKAEDVMIPESPSLFTTMKAKGIPLYIEPKFFTDPLHCDKLMGYKLSPEHLKLIESCECPKEKC